MKFRSRNLGWLPPDFLEAGLPTWHLEPGEYLESGTCWLALNFLVSGSWAGWPLTSWYVEPGLARGKRFAKFRAVGKYG